MDANESNPVNPEDVALGEPAAAAAGRPARRISLLVMILMTLVLGALFRVVHLVWSYLAGWPVPGR